MNEPVWWHDGVIYQIYPRSFLDTDGDGLGDLPGITRGLDYLADLGIDAIWLSPFYPSPDKDFGYDISDHCAVDPRFGTMSDFDTLLEQAHGRGIRVILDLVLNHTSDQHAWFQESRSSRDHPKRDWYIWQDPKPKGLSGSDKPNNWKAVFGGSAWEKDPVTGQYYLHLFVKEQPDVNWRNPAVRQAQLDVVRFWLQKGVDGFRLDVFNAYFKDQDLRNNPSQFGPLSLLTNRPRYDSDRPEMIPLLNELRAILDSEPGKFAVGETEFPTAAKAASYSGVDKLHAAFSFEFTGMGGIGVGWGPGWITKKIQERERVFSLSDLWPTTVMGNHDVPRPATRYCRGGDDAQAKIAMVLLLTLRGTPFLYYGDEIGMRDLKLKREQVMDPAGKFLWPFYKGRDGCRSPMQWDAMPQAGFTSGIPWLMLNPDYPQRNLAAQRNDSRSIYHLTRTLIALRKQTPALTSGDFKFLPTGSKNVLAYLRSTEQQKAAVVMNFSDQPVQINPSVLAGINKLLYSTHRSQDFSSQKSLQLDGNEISIFLEE